MADWTHGGATALREHAPVVLAALDGLVAAWPDGVGTPHLAAIRTVTAEGLGLRPLRSPAVGPRDVVPGSAGSTADVMAFAEQFAVDVSALSPEQRSAWLRVVGPAAFEATFAVWVADYVPRVRAVLDALFGPDTWWDAEPVRTPHARTVLDEVLREVALLDALDPVATELVRLRGARQHHCRLCMSRRSLDALRAGADAATFDALDRYRSSDLPPSHQAALALTDAVVWTPAHVRAVDVDAVRAHLTPAEAVEVVLDVLRNAANKIAVALGADRPEVDDGIQLFETDAEGVVTFP